VRWSYIRNNLVQPALVYSGRRDARLRSAAPTYKQVSCSHDALHQLLKARQEPTFSWTLCRIPVPPFVVIVKAEQLARLKTNLGDDMPQYLVAGYLPDDFDPSKADEAMGRDIHALNKEMIAAGVRKFACGLGSAESLRAKSDGGVLITDGPYLGPRNILAVFGYWNALTWTRWDGRAKASPPPGGRSRCERFSLIRPPAE
jgi:hypothetical protein